MQNNDVIKKNIKIIKIIIVIIAAVFFAWMLLKTFWLSDQFEAVYDFNKKTSSRISSLGPWYRLGPLAEKDGQTSQELKARLVYFTIAIPLNYSDIEITAKWQGNINKFEFGLEKSPDKHERKMAKIETNDDFKITTANFKVREFYLSNYLIKNNKLQAVISLPDLPEKQTIKISELKVTFKKSPPQKQEFLDFLRRVKKKLQ